MFTEEEAKEMGAVPFYKDLKDLRIGTTQPEPSSAFGKN